MVQKAEKLKAQRKGATNLFPNCGCALVASFTREGTAPFAYELVSTIE
jgi:hypothetical protein